MTKIDFKVNEFTHSLIKTTVSARKLVLLRKHYLIENLNLCMYPQIILNDQQILIKIGKVPVNSKSYIRSQTS